MLKLLKEFYVWLKKGKVGMQKANDYSRDGIRQELDKLGLRDVELSFFEEIGSTNTEMKNRLFDTGIPEKPWLFIAKRQSAGKGRLGRSFESPDAGVYMSILFPSDFSGARLTAYVAVMVLEAIEELSGINADIKWVNDIYFGGKKLSGILCEGIINAEEARLEASVIGIGINVLQTEFSKDVSEIATSLEEASGKKISRAELVARIAEKILKNLPGASEKELMEKYRSKSNLLGKLLKVTRGDESFFARAVDINEKAELIVVKETGEKIALNSGEVSAKIKQDNLT